MAILNSSYFIIVVRPSPNLIQREISHNVIAYLPSISQKSRILPLIVSALCFSRCIARRLLTALFSLSFLSTHSTTAEPLVAPRPNYSFSTVACMNKYGSVLPEDYNRSTIPIVGFTDTHPHKFPQTLH